LRHVSCVGSANVLHSALGVRCSTLGFFRFLSKAPTSFRILDIGPARLARSQDASGRCIVAHVWPAGKRSASELVLQKLPLPRTSWQRRSKLKFVCALDVEIGFAFCFWRTHAPRVSVLAPSPKHLMKSTTTRRRRPHARRVRSPERECGL